MDWTYRAIMFAAIASVHVFYNDPGSIDSMLPDCPGEIIVLPSGLAHDATDFTRHGRSAGRVGAATALGRTRCAAQPA